MPTAILNWQLMLAAGFLLRSHASASSYVLTRPAALVLTRAFHSSSILRSLAAMVEKVHTTERLAELRKHMRERNIDVYSTYGTYDSRRKNNTYHRQ
jgi:Xaa-Pro aminopeptidase